MNSKAGMIAGAVLGASTLGSTGTRGTEGPDSPWVVPPTPAALKATPGLVHNVLQTTNMPASSGYNVVLPEGYADSDRRYPVVYWLHGGGRNESYDLFTAKVWRELQESGEIEPVILVYPNGNKTGFMDQAGGKIRNESMIIQDLIPLIDRTYRTIATSAGRAVHGFSMGSSGALKFTMKHPELFCAAVAYGGASFNLEEDKTPWLQSILADYLDSDPTLIQQNNTYHFIAVNHAIVKQRNIRFLLITGDADPYKETAIVFNDTLKAKGISCELVLVPKVGHAIEPLYRIKGKEAALFQNAIFQGSK